MVLHKSDCNNFLYICSTKNAQTHTYLDTFTHAINNFRHYLCQMQFKFTSKLMMQNSFMYITYRLHVLKSYVKLNS